MSIVIHYENGKLIEASQRYLRTTPAPSYVSSDGKTFVIGEVFGASHEEIAMSDWKQNPNVLNDFDGAVSVVSAEKSECVFATDIHGIESWYTYHRNRTFIISDDFWDIIKIVQPKLSDIDKERVRASFSSPSIDGRTLIKDLSVVAPFTIGKYNADLDQLDVRKYTVFKYTNEVADIDEVVERMDQILNAAMQHIKKTCGDVKYGVGVSGGLDSRVIPHYAKENGMKLEGFNVCVPRPRGILLAQSCKNAEKIADAFKIPYKNTKWNPDTIELKIEKKIQRYPLGSGRNSFKYEPEMPEFDVLLTGASGLIVGSMLPEKINDFSREELIENMQSFFNKGSNPRTFFARAARGLNYIFGTKLKVNSKSAITKLIPMSSVEDGRNAMVDFIDNGIKEGQTNIEIYEDYFANVVGFRNRYGAFESILGEKRSFSIYVPFMLKETLRWKPELLFDRVVLKRLIIEKIPEVKDIQSESFETAPGKKTMLWRKVANMVGFLLRGNGVAVDEYWMKKHEVKKRLSSRLDNGCAWFNDIFEITDKSFKSTLMKCNEPDLMIDLWELKTLIDCLETKEYMNFDWI